VIADNAWDVTEDLTSHPVDSLINSLPFRPSCPVLSCPGVTSDITRDIRFGRVLAVIGKAHRVITGLVRSTPPLSDLRVQAGTDRVLQWVAHLYRFAMAISLNPAQQVEIALDLSHSTASRWVRLARQKGYLGPSEGPGKAAG
jgi:hypothetical protein